MQGWQGQALRDDGSVLPADGKTSIHLHRLPWLRRVEWVTADPRLEHEYDRGWALAYIAVLDGHRAKLFGRCDPKTGIASFDWLVAQVMAAPPYAEASRVLKRSFASQPSGVYLE